LSGVFRFFDQVQACLRPSKRRARTIWDRFAPRVRLSPDAG
jgi:hypothetical protein